MKQKHLGTIKPLLGGAALTAFMLVSASSAQAQDNIHATTLLPDSKSTPTAIVPKIAPGPEKRMNAAEKIHAAGLFSEKNPKGIGMFVNLARNPEIPPEVLIPALIKKLSAMTDGKAQIHAETNISDGTITQVMTFVDGIALPTFDLGTLKEGFTRTANAFEVEQARAARKRKGLPHGEK